ncbi:ion channel [Pseudomonas orientalis]|uniref:Potassium ABC transporter n=1 Tax=Pseudomonas orientalis TaxID=76758 RepID=A0A4Q7D5M1_9PSED|nr:ion channel [Pseudomonas orientalis]RZI33348.1 potassium ABC transporter [Pseudomonas orientalis]
MADLPRIKEQITNKLHILDIGAFEIQEKHEIILCFIITERKDETNSFHRVKNVTFKKCIFSGQVIKNINFYGCDFVDCIFNGITIDSCEFHKCVIKNSCFYKPTISNTYIDPKSFKFNYKWYRYYANVNAGLFQSLYRNSKDVHQEKFAMRADIKFLFYKRYENLFGQQKNIGKFITGFLFDILLGCGYGIVNVLFFTLTSIAGFAWLIKDFISPAENINLVKSLYFSIASFTTVGYGDLVPNKTDTALILTMIFLLSSVIWCALVTAIIVKRIVK